MDTSTTTSAPPTTVTTLCDNDSGVWRVTTASGSAYDLDLGEGLISRVPATTNDEGTMRRDGDTVILAGILWCAVGQRARFLIDLDVEGVAFTVRDTTEVVSIVPVS